MLLAANRGDRSPEETERFSQLFTTIAPQIYNIRVLGASALDLCYTAQGRFDGFFSNKAKIYDVVAGALIAEEAGRESYDFSGKPIHWTQRVSDIIVTSPEAKPKILPLFQNTR